MDVFSLRIQCEHAGTGAVLMQPGTNKQLSLKFDFAGNHDIGKDIFTCAIRLQYALREAMQCQKACQVRVFYNNSDCELTPPPQNNVHYTWNCWALTSKNEKVGVQPGIDWKPSQAVCAAWKHLQTLQKREVNEDVLLLVAKYTKLEVAVSAVSQAFSLTTTSDYQVPAYQAALREYKNLHKSFRKNKRVCLALVAKSANYDFVVPVLLNFKRYRDDEEVVLACVKVNGLNLQWASPRLRNTKDVVMAAVTQNGCAVRWASRRLKHVQAIAEAGVSTSSHLITALPTKVRRRKELMLRAISRDPKVFQFVAPCLQRDTDFVRRVFDCIESFSRYDPKQAQCFLKVLSHAKPEALDACLELVKKATVKYPALLMNVPHDMKHYDDVVMEVVGANSMALKYASKNAQANPDIVRKSLEGDLRAVLYARQPALDTLHDTLLERLDSLVLHQRFALYCFLLKEMPVECKIYASLLTRAAHSRRYNTRGAYCFPRYQTPTQVTDLVDVLRWVPDLAQQCHITLIVNLIVDQQSFAIDVDVLIRLMPSMPRTVKLRLLRQNGLALKYLAVDKDNVDLALEAVSQNGLALEHVSSRLKCCGRVVWTAVMQCADAFRHASYQIQGSYAKFCAYREAAGDRQIPTAKDFMESYMIGAAVQQALCR